jgi:hypothetical protein
MLRRLLRPVLLSFFTIHDTDDAFLLVGIGILYLQSANF